MTKYKLHKEQVQTLWMFWDKGENNIKDKYNKLCVEYWRKLNPDWKVNVLDDTTVSKFIPDIVNYDHLTVQLKSDLIRVKLLNKYGGVWADASTLPMKRLTGNIDNITRDDVFFYRYFKRCHKTNIYVSSWFIVAKQPNNYLINKLDEGFSKKCQTKDELPYFSFHYTLGGLYKTDKRIKNSIDKLKISQNLSHSVLRGRGYPKINISNVEKQPICYKRAKKIDETAYKNYIQKYIETYENIVENRKHTSQNVYNFDNFILTIIVFILLLVCYFFMKCIMR